MSFWLNELSIIKENYTMPRRTRPGTCFGSFFFFDTFCIIIRTLLEDRALNYIYIVLFRRYEFRAGFTTSITNHFTLGSSFMKFCEFFVVLFDKKNPRF